MTTRAGTAGLLAGLAAAGLLFLLWTPSAWAALAGAGALALAGGWAAARWSGSVEGWRCAALGAVSGGLAGALVFCLWGAAWAGSGGVLALARPEALVRQTLAVFLALFAGGGGLGMLGGALAGWQQRLPGSVDRFDKEAPQMAMNAAITAACATAVAAVLAALVFTRLGALLSGPAGAAGLAGTLVRPPLGVALLLTLIAQAALLAVVPHEARQAEHRCGTDEVKMAATVAIGVAPLLAALLLGVAPQLYAWPPLVAALLVSAGLSLAALQVLRRVVLPRRAAFPVPPAGRAQAEARYFGSIARSRGPRLAVLCAGCGLLMVLPFYIVVAAPLINLSQPAGDLYRLQALASTGLIVAASAALTGMYWFYLWLGRWYSRR